MRIHVRDARQQLLNKEMQADDATRIHYAAVYARSANYWKNALGMNEGLVSLDVFDAKRAQEQALLQWENAMAIQPVPERTGALKASWPNGDRHSITSKPSKKHS